MDLSEHFDRQGWLADGWHEVEITKFEEFQYNSGSDGVQFALRTDDGRQQKVSFCLVDTIVWQLAQFAKACGLSKEAARSYRHGNLVGLRVQVLVVLDGKYHKVDDWAAIGEKREDPPARPQQEQSASSPPTGDGIPF